MGSLAVAITGLSCRFPGKGSNVSSFWESLCRGESAWSPVPIERFRSKAYWTDPSKHIEGAHFLKEDASRFDAAFFGISAAEAASMDPQHRLMLEVSFEALESAGLSLESIAGTKMGVFMAHFTSDYKSLIYRDPDRAPALSATGLQATSLANRISWIWDLRGPSFVVDTACSSSLVALHLACQSIRNGECDTAIVGGCNLLLSPEVFLFFGAQGFLSPDGKSKSFDATADGYGRGEGIAAIILKRASDCVDGRDSVRAVICASACNQDGGRSSSFTSPSTEAQEHLIRETYEMANLEMSATGYVEAHGTGTQAGDTTETRALSRSLAVGRTPANKLLVGSVKANIGHLEAAAGLAAIIKSILILEHGIIPPNIHLSHPNPDIPFEQWNLKVPTELCAYPTTGPRQVSINSFGYGGTNAHAILQDPSTFFAKNRTNQEHCVQDRISLHTPHRAYLFPIHAQDRDGILRVRRSLLSYIKKRRDETPEYVREDRFLRDLASTLGKKSRLQWKSHLVTSSMASLMQQLESGPTAMPDRIQSQEPRIGFVFTGQGSQWAAMGTQLTIYKVFRESLEAADSFMTSELGCTWSALDELRREKQASRLGLAEFSQSLCTVLQVALVELLQTWGITPVAVCGHSSGEIAAAFASGALSREDAWTVAYWRGQVAGSLKSEILNIDGTMAAVGTSSEYIEELISEIEPGEVCVACKNSPSSTTVSGDRLAVETLVMALAERKLFARMLRVDTAYHSPHMQLVQDDYMESLDSIFTQQEPTSCRMYSSVTSSLAQSDELGPGYWVRNLVSPVLFCSAIQELVRPTQHGKRATSNIVDVLIEIGPHPALETPTLQSLEAIGVTNLPYFSALIRDKDGIDTAARLAGKLLNLGARIDVPAVNGLGETAETLQGEKGANFTTFEQPAALLTDFPSYPWNHSQSHWGESRLARHYRERQELPNSLLGTSLPTVSPGIVQWRNFIDLSHQSWITDHKILGSVLFPGAGYLVMAMEAALQVLKPSLHVSLRLKHVEFLSALELPSSTVTESTITLQSTSPDCSFSTSSWIQFVIASFPDSINAINNCTGFIQVEDTVEESERTAHKNKERYSRAVEDCDDTIETDQFYSRLGELGLDYGPNFSLVTSLRNRTNQCCFDVTMPESTSGDPTFFKVIHPILLDAIVHAGFAAIDKDINKMRAVMLPSRIEMLAVSLNIQESLVSAMAGQCIMTDDSKTQVTADFSVHDSNSQSLVVEMTGFVFTEVPTGGDKLVPKRKLCSSSSSMPAIDFLTLDQQRCYLQSSEGDLFDKLSLYISILHFSNPNLVIAEICSDGQGDDAIFQRLSIPHVLTTSKCSMYFPTKAGLQRIRKISPVAPHSSGSALSQIELTDIRDIKADILLIANSQQIEASLLNLENMITMTKVGGAICTLERSCETEASSITRELSESFTVADMDMALTIALPSSLLERNTSARTSQSTQSKKAAEKHKKVVIMQSRHPSKLSVILQSELVVSLEGKGYNVSQIIWDRSTIPLKDELCISMMELSNPVLARMDEKTFDAFKVCALDSLGTFWLYNAEDPMNSLVEGFARTIRNEQPGIKFHTLGVNLSPPASPIRLCELVTNLITSPGFDQEYIIKDEMIWVNRIVENAQLNQRLNSSNEYETNEVTEMPISDIEGGFEVTFEASHRSELIVLPSASTSEEVLGSEEVEVELRATSLCNQRHTERDSASLHQPHSFYHAGIVRGIGSNVSKLQVGDRVVFCKWTTVQSRIRLQFDMCKVLPEDTSFDKAVSLASVSGLAWYSLIKLARITKDHTVLVHDAAQQIGQAAIQLALHAKVNIFVTVMSLAEKKLLSERYGIPDSAIFELSSSSYEREILAATDGCGVEVILHSLTAYNQQPSSSCFAPQAQLIFIGDQDSLGVIQSSQKPLRRLETVHFVDRQYIQREQAALAVKMLHEGFGLIERGILVPADTDTNSITISQFRDETSLLTTNRSEQDVILTLSSNDIVPVFKPQATLNLDPDAAYMLIGGFGGVGRSVAMLLADLGARKLCFVSRSGPASESAKELVRDLELRGVEVKSYQCDIVSADAVRQTIAVCHTQFGILKGVIISAMVLRDALFSKMTYTQWKEATDCKVIGSWNLHSALAETPLDFFIMLSSFAGIFGNRGQANYNSGNAFQDGLARYRREKGLAGISIDLGIMRDIGVLAETGMVEGLQDWVVPYGIDEVEFKKLMHQAIFSDIFKQSDSQIITAIATGGSAQQHGIATPFYLEDDPRFSIMAQIDLSEEKSLPSTESQKKNIKLATTLSSATTLDQAIDLVTTGLKGLVAKMQQVPVDEVDEHRSLTSYGISSLDTVTFISWALKETHAKISLFDVMTTVSISSLASKIAKSSTLLAAGLDL